MSRDICIRDACKELGVRGLREEKADTRDLKQEWPGMSGNKQEGQCDQNRVNEAEEKER